MEDLKEIVKQLTREGQQTVRDFAEFLLWKHQKHGHAGAAAGGHADLDRISFDPGVCHGKPCIKGTRIPVHLIAEMLAAGESIETVLESYPSLSREDVEAAVEYSKANEA